MPARISSLSGQAGANEDSVGVAAAVVEKPSKQKTKSQGPSKNRQREQEKAERAVEEAEAAMKALEDELADPAAWVSKYEAAKSEARHTSARRAVEDAYARLQELVD